MRKEKKMNPYLFLLFIFLQLPYSIQSTRATPPASETAGSSPVDVLHYNVWIEPNIASKSLQGSVVIRFISSRDQIQFDCGDLVIDAVREHSEQLQFSVEQHKLKIELPQRRQRVREVAIDYHGAPKRGIRFFPDREQVYTVYATSQWMVCVDAPNDKAALTLKLILPDDLTPLANGRLVSRSHLANKKVATIWEQRRPIPTYIFGFVGGPFKTITVKSDSVELRYLSTGFTDVEVPRIFRDTPDMLRFYEERSGVPYADRTYTQVLAAGGVEQEMSSFTALKEAYGKQLLANEQDLWLGAHEFAHQWWGNMVTCQDWIHFWLNEGIATFMAAAYIEHRFGRPAYLKEIESYRTSYEKVRVAGKDKSLVFPDWDHPTSEDRTLVYDKGAYVLHLLREEMGERDFWSGLRIFTRRHFGKSVVTSDFTTAMQEATRKPLGKFFAKWVYFES